MRSPPPVCGSSLATAATRVQPCRPGGPPGGSRRWASPPLEAREWLGSAASMAASPPRRADPLKDAEARVRALTRDVGTLREDLRREVKRRDRALVQVSRVLGHARYEELAPVCVQRPAGGARERGGVLRYNQTEVDGFTRVCTSRWLALSCPAGCRYRPLARGTVRRRSCGCGGNACGGAAMSSLVWRVWQGRRWTAEGQARTRADLMQGRQRRATYMHDTTGWRWAAFDLHMPVPAWGWVGGCRHKSPRRLGRRPRHARR